MTLNDVEPHVKGCVLRRSIALDTVQKYVDFAFGLIITEY